MLRAVFLVFAVTAAQSAILPRATYLDAFYSYDGMVSYLKNMSQSFSHNMSLKSLATTAENRSVYLVKVFGNETRCPKKVILLDAAIYGNEWITTTVALKAIHELVVIGHKDIHGNLLERSDWYILPMVNPDGYEYSSRYQNHDWQKNRSPNGVEFGVNLNRNFDFNWNKSIEDDSASPWSPNFRGTKAFSEPESRAIGDLMRQLVADKKEFLYISLHTDLFMGLTKNNATPQAIAEYMSKKILAAGKSEYYLSLPFAYKGVGGTSLDYAYKQGIPLAFDLEFFQPKAGGQNMSSSIANATFEGWSGVFYLTKQALQSTPTDDSECSDYCDDCNTDKKASSSGDLSPLIGLFGTLLTYLSYTLLS